MKRYAQLICGRVHWIFEAEELPPYPNPEDFLDITGREEIEEGYLYDAKTGEFTAPVAPEPIEQQPTVEEMQAKTLLNTEVLIAMKNIGV
ncbi:hypothetical protein [Lysinibacillus sp. Ag94]|uniref:hypothetical protein n=1 Tax=Lysinibacillus sp. Ag94 TaxID=2936682 RepID=UPI00200BD4A0|nr:hypothetical protein [Lysinibacillus sp. Ag94]UPW82714.1 hypothetical protein MY533_18665 [Lysinibacillus sp. Ag94]